MRKRPSIAVCLMLGVSFALGVGCSSIPDSRKTLPSGYEPDAGVGGSANSGGAGGSAGSSAGGASTGGTEEAGGTGAGGVVVGSGGKAGTSKDGGGEPDAGPGIPCGNLHCHGREVGNVTVSACCAGAAKNLCGLETVVFGEIQCVEPNQNGKLNAVCPASDDNTLNGCCRPSKGTCGLLLEPTGGPYFGCIDPTEVGVATTAACTAPTCSQSGVTCTTDAQCCSGKAGAGACVEFLNQTNSVCTSYCVTNGDCVSGCCVALTGGRGACASDASACGTTCRKADDTCDTDTDCCAGNVCAPSGSAGPRRCRPTCTTDDDCKTTIAGPGFCVKDASGRATCADPGSGICNNDCNDANDGSCDDGGPGSVDTLCALGSDCIDCGTRVGGFSVCSDTCATKGNGKCEDGGTTSVASSCGFGTDCTDCGPRLGICTDDCQYAGDGSCDDGGVGAAYQACALGTDCSDCGSRIGGRGQSPCDGSSGYQCTPAGGLLSDDIDDDICECTDCAWDASATDCAVSTSKCDGKTISACCAAGNPCGLDGNGICDCGGWCDWEKKDCGAGAFGLRCDGVTISTMCNYKTPKTADGECDCEGACSWEQADCVADGVTTLCADTCPKTGTHTNVNDGSCDDGGPGSNSKTCALGTDCADCGPR